MNHHKNCLSNHNGPCNCADLEEVRVCCDCHAEVVEKSFLGTDGVAVCLGCHNVEQDFEYWSVRRFEEEGYHV